jgi:hypothetical protein
MGSKQAGGSAAARTRGGARRSSEFIEPVEGGWARAGTRAAWGGGGTRKLGAAVIAPRDGGANGGAASCDGADDSAVATATAIRDTHTGLLGR